MGDCIDLQFRSHATDFEPMQDNYSKLNMHIHMVHFDPTASDGVIIGYNWEQSARPCTDIGQVTDLVSAAKDNLGETAIALAPEMQYRDVWPHKQPLGGGEGPTHNVLTPDSENIVNRLKNTVEWNGRPWEYAHYRWFADIQMIAFWHPHIGGFLAFPLGVTNGTIVEPVGSEYYDRVTGIEKYAHTDKVTYNPFTGKFRNDTSKEPVSGTADGYPFLPKDISEFGGNPELGWALADLDFEETTKVINITAAQEVDGCGGNNGRPCGNRDVQTGEDIPLFGGVDFRAGPSGLADDDCGGVGQIESLDFFITGATNTANLKHQVALRNTGGACGGEETDDSSMGAASGVRRVAGGLVPSLNSTLRTDRIFNRTNSEFNVLPNTFITDVDTGGTEFVDVHSTDMNDLGKKPAPSFREGVFFWTDDIYLMYGNGTSTPFNNRIAATSGVSGVSLRNEPLDRKVKVSGLNQENVFTNPPAAGGDNGDPSTPLLMANPGDRVIVRSFMGGTQDMHTFRFLGHRFGNERANAYSNPIDSVQSGIGYFNTYEIMGGAGAKLY